MLTDRSNSTRRCVTLSFSTLWIPAQHHFVPRRPRRSGRGSYLLFHAYEWTFNIPDSVTELRPLYTSLHSYTLLSSFPFAWLSYMMGTKGLHPGALSFPFVSGSFSRFNLCPDSWTARNNWKMFVIMRWDKRDYYVNQHTH